MTECNFKSHCADTDSLSHQFSQPCGELLINNSNYKLSSFQHLLLIVISRITQVEVKSWVFLVLVSQIHRTFWFVINLSELKIRIFCHSVFPHLLLILKHQINLLSKWYGGFSKIYHSLRSR